MRNDAEQRAYENMIAACDLERLAIEYYRLTYESPTRNRSSTRIIPDKQLVLQAIRKHGERLHYSID